MARLVCFFDDESAQTATCLAECLNPDQHVFDCESCEYNPFPGKIVPEDRVLRKVTFDPPA